MKIILAVAVTVLLAACGKPAETSAPAGRDFVVDRLFHHEGCTVYRFADGGNYRYFTNCSGSTQWTESCGKGCYRSQGVN